MESLRAWVRRFRGSLLVMPLAIVIAAIVAARLVTLLDHDQVPGEIPGLLSISVAGGRAIAGSVAGATITVAAIVFSITSLSSQIAATQYSPRAVAGFLEDRLQKVVIGLIVGTFVFSLMVLADLSGVALPDEPPRPSVAVTLVLLLALVAVVQDFGRSSVAVLVASWALSLACYAAVIMFAGYRHRLLQSLTAIIGCGDSSASDSTARRSGCGSSARWSSAPVGSASERRSPRTMNESPTLASSINDHNSFINDQRSFSKASTFGAENSGCGRYCVQRKRNHQIHGKP